MEYFIGFFFFEFIGLYVDGFKCGYYFGALHGRQWLCGGSEYYGERLAECECGIGSVDLFW